MSLVLTRVVTYRGAYVLESNHENAGGACLLESSSRTLSPLQATARVTIRLLSHLISETAAVSLARAHIATVSVSSNSMSVAYQECFTLKFKVWQHCRSYKQTSIYVAKYLV